LLVGVLAAVSGHVVTDTFMSLELASSWLFWALLGATLTVVSTADKTPQQAT
jgi:hypothetical protein